MQAIKAGRYSVNTQHTILGTARQFCRWAIAEGHLKTDLLVGLRLASRRTRGDKAQLRVDEARKFLSKAVAMANAGALAAAFALLTGVRASEITERVGRDVDDGGRLLWITNGKTESSNRKVAIPSILVPHFQRLAEEAGPEGRLVGTELTCRLVEDRVTWLRHAVARVCKLAASPSLALTA